MIRHINWLSTTQKLWMLSIFQIWKTKWPWCSGGSKSIGDVHLRKCNSEMLLVGGLGKPTQNLKVQLTLFQPGGRLCPPHYCFPTQIWKPIDISATIILSLWDFLIICSWHLILGWPWWRSCIHKGYAKILWSGLMLNLYCSIHSTIENTT